MSKEKTIKVLIADDHYVVRMGLAAMVKTESDMEVVGEAEDGREAIRLYERYQPDILLMDSRMPVLNGVETTIEILKKYPKARVLMISAYDGDADIQRALEAGVQGYVLKQSAGDRLLPAIRAVAAGKKWLSRAVAGELALRKSYEQLTPRELDVLKEISLGLANKQIADSLGISEHTVKDHVKNVLAKLRVSDRTEAVAVGVKRGFIHL
ncbi:MAG: response regulator [Roseibacillus sp.]